MLNDTFFTYLMLFVRGADRSPFWLGVTGSVVVERMHNYRAVARADCAKSACRRRCHSSNNL